MPKQEKKYKVYTPNPHFTGVRNGVQITKGEGEATKDQLPNLINIYGYYVEGVSKAEDKPDRLKSKADVAAVIDQPLEEKETAEGAEESEKAEVKGEKDGPSEIVEPVELPERIAKDATNDELKAFMKANGIEFESDNNKDTLNEKIDAWYESQTEEAGSSK